MKTLTLILLFSPLALSQVRYFPQITPDSLMHCPVEKYPTIIGGLDSLLMNLQYPQEAKENNIEGKLYVMVTLDSLGNITYIKLFRSLGYGCDEEAIRLVKSAKFTPAYHYKVISSNDEVEKKYSLVPVRSVISIPIKFKLQ